jgi:hypothetical protein
MPVEKPKNLLKIFLIIAVFCLIGAVIFFFSNEQKKEANFKGTEEYGSEEIGGYVVVDPSGTCERKGMVQVRLSMYLYPGDYGYEKQYVQIPVFPEEGYPGEISEGGSPVDAGEYESWVNGLPKEWVNNPFHNHFIYVEPTVSDEEIMNMAEMYLKEAYEQWSNNEAIDLKNPVIFWPSTVDEERLAAVEAKVQYLKTASLIRQNNIEE